MNGYLPGMEHEERDVSLGQYFTPPELAARMAELVDLRGKRVLEPSAGSGNLVRAALDAGARAITAMDIDGRNFDALSSRFADDLDRVDVCLPRDFLEIHECALEEGPFLACYDADVALMNPPWDDGVHWKHIQHALKFAPIVVALAPLAMLEGEERRDAFWSKVWLRQLNVCSNRPDFGPKGGKMPVAAYVIERQSWDNDHAVFWLEDHKVVMHDEVVVTFV